jgi:hypothetical protein
MRQNPQQEHGESGGVGGVAYGPGTPLHPEGDGSHCIGVVFCVCLISTITPHTNFTVVFSAFFCNLKRSCVQKARNKPHMLIVWVKSLHGYRRLKPVSHSTQNLPRAGIGVTSPNLTMAGNHRLQKRK